MSADPVDVYGDELLDTASRARVRYDDGTTAPLDVSRWNGPVTAGDVSLLARCTAPTLDIGCGPGRLSRALMQAGVECVGVDVAPAAVALARSGGVRVLHASVYDRLLDDTTWSTVLLADGNIGIGGAPVQLLARAAALSRPGGQVLVELDPPGTGSRTVRVRLETRTGRRSRWFPWAHVDVQDAERLGAHAGLVVTDTWCSEDRWFARFGTAR